MFKHKSEILRIRNNGFWKIRRPFLGIFKGLQDLIEDEGIGFPLGMTH